MLQQEIFRVDDPGWTRDLARARPWATPISHTAHRGLVVSHLPVLVDDAEQGAAPTLLGDLARTDAEEHELGSHEVVHGRPEVLDPADTHDVLPTTVDHSEAPCPEPWRPARVDTYAHRIAAAVTGFRLAATRVTARAKLRQDEREDVVIRLTKALESDHPYAHPDPARAMRDIRRKP